MCIISGETINFERSAAGGWSLADTKRCTRRISAHDHLFYEGEERTHLYLIEGGWVKLYRTLVEGQRQVVGFCNGGSILGLEGGEEYLNGCEAITDVTVRVIPVSRLSEICARDPELACHVLRQAGRQLGIAQGQLATVGARTAEQRLAIFLLAFADYCDGSGGAEFALPMKRIEMGEFLGLRLETISRKMSDFQQRGWIRMASTYRCRLINRGALEHLAEGGDAESSAWARLPN